MDLASLILSCSVHADDALLSTLARVHSNGNPFVVINVDVAALDSQDDPLPTAALSIDAARLAAVRIQALGGQPVLGLLPVRPEWASEFGKAPDELFDPCSNIAVASAKISEADYGCRTKGRRLDAPARRACTLDVYGALLALPGLRRVVLVELLTAPGEPERPYPELEQGFAASPSAGSGLFFSLAPAGSALPLQEPEAVPATGADSP